MLGTESRREEGIASSSFSLLGPQSPLGRLSDYLVPFSYGAETPGEVLKRAVTFGGRQELGLGLGHRKEVASKVTWDFKQVEIMGRKFQEVAKV